MVDVADEEALVVAVLHRELGVGPTARDDLEGVGIGGHGDALDGQVLEDAGQGPAPLDLVDVVGRERLPGVHPVVVAALVVGAAAEPDLSHDVLLDRLRHVLVEEVDDDRLAGHGVDPGTEELVGVDDPVAVAVAVADAGRLDGVRRVAEVDGARLRLDAAGDEDERGQEAAGEHAVHVHSVRHKGASWVGNGTSVRTSHQIWNPAMTRHCYHCTVIA